MEIDIQKKPDEIDRETWQRLLWVERRYFFARLHLLGLRELTGDLSAEDLIRERRAQVRNQPHSVMRRVHEHLVPWRMERLWQICLERRARSTETNVAREEAEKSTLAWVLAATSRTALWHRRVQFAVGQGGFHAGIVRKFWGDWTESESDFGPGSDDGFFYIYDCGSEPVTGVNRAIEELLKLRGRRSLDMFVLSHFDRDHMCGVPRLLHSGTGFQVDTILMPHIDEAERIVDFARNAWTRTDRASDRFFEDMVVDPIATLRQFEPRQIIQILGDEDGPPPDVAAEETGPPEGTREAVPWKLVQRTPGRPIRCWRTGDGVVYARSGAIDTLGSGAECGWRLTPYVHKASADDLRKFKRAVEAKLGWGKGSFSKRIKSDQVRRDLVTIHRTKISEVYKRIFGDKNTTSLCLYSGPTARENVLGFRRNGSGGMSISRLGWMGTGDAELKQAAASNAFVAHYADELEEVSTFVLPHHGSIKNSDPKNLISNADRFVAAAKPAKKEWRHPAPALRRAVLARGKIFRRVGVRKHTSLDERMLALWLS